MAIKEAMVDLDIGGAYPAELYHYQGIATGIRHFEDVTEAHLDQFHQEGYLVIEQAFTPDEVQDTLAGFLDLIAGTNPDFRGIQLERVAENIAIDSLPVEDRQDYVRKFMSFVNYDARLLALSQHPKLIDVLTRLIGHQPYMFQDMALLKPPKIGREKPWHQDMAYFNLSLNETVVGVWIALDEASLDNGCLIINSGSHRQGPMIHFRRRDWQICDTDVHHQGRLAVPLKPGGCLFFHGLLHHGTPANDSTLRRRAVQFHYRSVDAKQTSQQERLAIFGSEGKDVSC